MARDMEEPGSSAQIPKMTGRMQWFFTMSAGTKPNCAFNNSNLNGKTKLIKNGNLAFSKDYISTRGNFALSILNAPKWRRSARNRNSRVMQRFRVRVRL